MLQGRFICRSKQDTTDLACRLAGEIISPCVIAFCGDLGAGKTFFIQSMCECWGVSEPVVSPTFSLLGEYRGRDFDIFHFDAYRLDSEAFFDAGFGDYLFSDGVCLIEWAENVFLGVSHLEVHISGSGDDERSISISYHEAVV